MARLIVLDTETTGFAPHLGHRLVEIGAVPCAPRTLHGALTDARLLASAYLRLVTYQERAQPLPVRLPQRPAARRYRPGSQAWPGPSRR